MVFEALRIMQYYKPGVVFLAWFNSLQTDFTMSGGICSTVRTSLSAA